ncbi:NFX1-type zinc finger-containing protein 1 [Folsomia candida]|uniref:NFX1-type zinc finger-containing protein 1 n=1 Tax=Folsomia candida TaxID=158441 RepID=A0A226E6R0_FOLCA|nr:NFX1-type zinc finger-containing protein 1 [Folsomia candida]
MGDIKKFKGKRKIPGFNGNLLFYAHGKECLMQISEKLSVVDTFGCDMVAGVCRHLLLNNFPVHQIQVMCNKLERIKQMSSRFQCQGSKPFQAIKLLYTEDDNIDTAPSRCVTILDLVSLGSKDEQKNFICSISKAIAKSRNGVIIIASFMLILKANDEEWVTLINKMYKSGYIKPFLSVRCDTHNKVCRDITTAEELSLASPRGGCLEICRWRGCGHECGSVCHPVNTDHCSNGDYLCRETCQLICCNGHHCILPCYHDCVCEWGCIFLRNCGHPLEDKDTVCYQPCQTPLKCGHPCSKICSECDKSHEDVECKKRCDKTCPRGHPCVPHRCDKDKGCPPCRIVTQLKLECRHMLTITCSDPDFDEENYVCHLQCERTYAFCGHRCVKRCYEECGPCETISLRPHPKCGHPTPSQCHVPILDPCIYPVQAKNPSFCGHEILVPCYLSDKLSSADISVYCRADCVKGVTNVCGHDCKGSCMRCYQGRFHIRCTEPCEKSLICRHFKICGETCDREGCREPCPKLLPCQHPCVGFCGETCPDGCRICTPDKLIDFLELSGEETRFYVRIPPCGHAIEESNLTEWLSTKNTEIKLKFCPICLVPIHPTLKRFSLQIQECWKDVQQVKSAIRGDENEIKKRLEQIEGDVIKILESGSYVPKFPKLGNHILTELRKPMKTTNKSRVTFDSMSLGKVQCIEWVFKEWKRVEESLPLYENLWIPEYFNKFKAEHTRLFDFTMRRIWPLHVNEVEAIRLEFTRVSDIQRLYERISLEMEDHILKLGKSVEGQKKFREAEAALYLRQPYTEEAQIEFDRKFKVFSRIQNYTLQLTDRERQEIVDAFGTRAGRWFKCPNGHVFVVTECGGPTERGLCNECGAPIGGEDHQLIEENQLATEMDGAQAPIWTTALQR